MADRRVERTRRSLHEALMALVVETDYDSITIQQILDRADVGRSTFYMHFRDKEELLVSGVRHMQTMLTEAQQRERSKGGTHESLIAFSRTMFDHAHEYRKVYRALVASQVWPRIRQNIQEIVTDIIRREWSSVARRSPRPKTDIPPELFIHYLSSTFLTVLEWWMDSRSTLSAGEIDLVFRALVLPSIRAVVA